MDTFACFSKHRSFWLGLAVLCVPCLMLAGCKQGESRVPTFPASGQLLSANDKPIANALVVLHPVDINSKAPKSRATTDADGKFQLTTYDTGDGAPEGDFIVTVEQWLGDDPNEAPTNKLPGTWSRPESSTLRIAITKATKELDPIRLR